MAFKPKPNKKIYANPIITLDKTHEKKMNTYYDNETVKIPNLEKQIIEKKSKGQSVIDLEIQIKKLKNEKKTYLLKNSKYVFDYFENKKGLSTDNTKPKILDNFFGINKETNKMVLKKHNETVSTYFKSIDPQSLNLDSYYYDNETCENCGKGELIPIEYEGIVVCNNCFVNTPYIYQKEKPSYKEPPQEVSFYAYKRINHFREILAQFQAKETTQISDDLIERIRSQITKERINLVTLTNTRTKSILKKLGLNKYYEHIPFIKDRLGIKPPIMTQDLEEKLCSLFLEIQRPYSRCCPDHRVNFLNYYYTIYKLCEMLGQNQFLAYFPMLKDREKRIEQDEIWKKICKELEWRFIATI
tara:strand:+ start:2390 stop:3463 length:1074 start_codon:yes stop_codon:yes gene_type:complete